MAFEYAGNMYGATPFVMEKVPLAANCYQGQLARLDADAGGVIEPVAAAAAGPDTTSYIVGIVSAIRTSPTYNGTYQGDLGTYDTTQATQVANDPVGPCLADITIIRPGDKIKAPVCFTTIGTAPTVITTTGTSTTGLTFVGNALAVTSISQYSVAYCRTGANRGQYRKITTGATGTQTVLVAFTYDIAVGDTFVVVNLAPPGSTLHFDVDTQFQAVVGNWATSYYRGQTLELNLEEAGKEFIVFTINPAHLAYTV